MMKYLYYYMGHFLIMELGNYDYHGITANNWPHPCGITAVVNSIPAVIPSAVSPIPRDYRGYRGNPVIPITMQLPRTQSRSRKMVVVVIVVTGLWTMYEDVECCWTLCQALCCRMHHDAACKLLSCIHLSCKCVWFYAVSTFLLQLLQ